MSVDREPNEVEAVLPRSEMSSDSIMLDSPAQTPTPKSHPAPLTNSSLLSNDIAMIDDNNPGGVSAATNSTAWDTQKYREDLTHVKSRLQHQSFDISRLPLSLSPLENVFEIRSRVH